MSQALVDKSSRSDLITIVLHIVAAMQTDYAQTFKKIFNDQGLLRDLKNRMYQKLKGYPVLCIVDAYEKWTDDFPSRMPGVVDLVRYVAAENTRVIRAQQEQRRIEQAAGAEDKQTVQCNPIQMLREALENSGKVSLEQRRIDHEALIARHYAEGKIKRYQDDSGLDPVRHDCAFGGCAYAGVLSAGVTGGGRFYCREHFFKTVGR